MEESEIYRKLAEIERKENKHSFFFNLGLLLVTAGFIIWFSTKAILLSSEQQKLKVIIIEQRFFIEELKTHNQEFRKIIEDLLDKHDQRNSRSEA